MRGSVVAGRAVPRAPPGGSAESAVSVAHATRTVGTQRASSHYAALTTVLREELSVGL
ncbi:hypothetical protein GCM10010515_36610 [Streptomyces fructofermentans]|uniref:Uncharacterized protein n=1 Tax=Streptomyces fructofermentans TaxID=152141 RepID=A0A918NGE6_9ACTN|nr:hypothetical protein GCM10010515_36610 [Streptomyces fructofermentans]